MPLESLPAEFLFTITAMTGEKPTIVIPNGPNGTRVPVTAMSGTFEGPKLKGKVAAIYMTYTGLGRTADGSTTLRTVPRFETADERYTWLNSVQAVAHGTTGTGSVTYDVYGLL